MTKKYGGPEKYYSDFYINSVCPIGFTQTGVSGREKNYNYYDSPDLTAAVNDFIVWNIREQISTGISVEVCWCPGTGKR